MSLIYLSVEVFQVKTLQTDYPFERCLVTETGQTEMVFSVRSCQEVSLALSAHPGKTYFDTYVIDISRPGDLLTTIRDSVDATYVNASGGHGGLRGCDIYSPFWLTWRSGTITIGQGPRIGESISLTWTPVNMHSITSISPRSHSGDADWLFTREAGKSKRFCSLTIQNHIQIAFTNIALLNIDSKGTNVIKVAMGVCFSSYDMYIIHLSVGRILN